MVLVFFIGIIVIFITLLICMIILSTVRIQVDQFEMSNKHIYKPKKYKVIISLYVFNKVKWLGIHLNDKKMRDIYSKSKLEKIDLKKLKKDFKWQDLKTIKSLQPKFSQLDLKFKIGTEDVIATSFIIFAISTLISIILPYTIKKYEKNKYHYEILPLYNSQNSYEIKFNCIIEIKMVHIINMVYVFLKKRRVDKNERTSNRRTYGYSYE